jgi:hypothetical protein
VEEGRCFSRIAFAINAKLDACAQSTGINFESYPVFFPAK